MAQVCNTIDPAEETYDIFLCTRELPDTLTEETAALRQLCAALIGSGYRVFFPPSTLFGQEPEAQARAIAAAVQKTPVMIAAAVGDEGAQDQTARFLWGKFRALAGENPSRTFIACCRGAESLPEELGGQDVMDMGDLEFLVKLKEKLSAALPEVVRAPEPEEEAPPAEEPEEAAAHAPAEEPEKPAPETKRPRWPWIALAAAAVVIVILILALCLK